jgi:cytochrome P450
MTAATATPPGRLGPPFLGESLGFFKDPIAFYEQRFRKYGPVFRTRVMGDVLVCLVGPDALTFLYDERYFQREGGMPPHFKELLGEEAVIFKDGAAHKRTRGLMAHAFSREALEAYQPLVERVIDSFLKNWETAGELRGADEMGALSFSIADCLFAGADPDAKAGPMLEAFRVFLAGLLAPPIRLPFTSFGKALKARDQLRAYVAGAVERAPPGNHALQRMLAARGDDGKGFTPSEIKTETLHFFGAAYAAIQGTLCDLLIALAQNPAVKQRAREEARAGKRQYLDQVTREVRRFYPIAPSTFIAKVKEDCEFGGFRIEKNWKAVGVLHSSMRDAGSFPEPDRFDPDRFAPERGEAERSPPRYVPHGAGPTHGHRCAGEQLANVLLVTFLQKVVEYDWELPPQDLTLKPGGLAPLPADGLRVRFRRA